MMNIKKIEGADHRYLSELPEFKNGIPFGVINKSKTDVGGTYVAANCDCNYIIVCPFRDLVDSIAADKNNKYPVFKCYGGTRENELKSYLKNNRVHKIAVTYDSLPKLVRWIGTTEGYKLLVDEYHLILEDMDFRYDAIDGLLNEIKKFKHYSFLSATPIDFEFEIDFIKNLPHHKVYWNGYEKITPIRYKTTNVTKGLSRMIQIFLEEGFNVPDINGELQPVEELYIFLNSVTTIKQIVDTLELAPEDVKICCASRIRNMKILGKEYEIESVSSPNKKINFFTKKCFQGCNLFTNNGLIIVASDAYKTQTLVDISTTLEQIAGRLRLNNEYQNIFRKTLFHIYSTNRNLTSDEDFEEEMEAKKNDADNLIEMTKNYNLEQMQIFQERTNLEADIVSIINGKMIYNPLKEQSFRYKHNLRKVYRDGFSVRNGYSKSEKFKDYKNVDQQNWNDIDIKLAKAMTISYQQLLKDYIEHPSESYELEYPEFKDIVKYLKESEMNTLRWNKEKMMKAVADKKLLDKVFLNIHKVGFISNADLKALFKNEFERLGVKLSAKATLIEDCTLYPVEKKKKKIDGKTVSGYEIGEIKFNFKF